MKKLMRSIVRDERMMTHLRTIGFTLRYEFASFIIISNTASYRQLVEMVGNWITFVYFPNSDRLNVHEYKKDQGQANLDESHREVDVLFALMFGVNPRFNHSD